MDLVNNLLDQVASLQGKFSTPENPGGLFTDPNTHEYHMSLIFQHHSHNEVHVPLVMKEAKGAIIWDVTGKKYIDFMASHGAMNQGHCHPKILEAITEQGKKLTLTASICNHDQLGTAAKFLTEKLKYDKILFRNSGFEAVDTAILTARRWGYMKKKIPYGKASVVFVKNCYWGMQMAARSGCTTEDRRELCEPLATEELGFEFVDYDNTEQLEAKFQENPNICAFIFEPILGHAGNIYPSPGYYKNVRELCTKYNVLMITDEIQSGLGRTGRLYACDWEDVRADIVALGKSFSGGFFPVSAVLADNEIMNVWPPPASHLSTFAANPLSCAVAVAAVGIIFDEGLIERSEKLGKIVEEELKSYEYDFIVKKNFGKGLFASLEFKDKMSCWVVCVYMMKNGVLVKPEGEKHLKVMPPLCISEEDLREGLKVLKEGLEEYKGKGKLALVL